MQIFINNKLAAIKNSLSFEFVSENRLFSGADAYTLEIELPLKDCPQNIEIFGKLFRKDVSAKNLIFDCEIRDNNFYKAGCVTVTGLNESTVKVQFLEGRSVQNFDSTFDDIFINELDLGAPPTTLPSDITPEEAMNPAASGFEAVCLPWVMGSSDSMIIHNEMVEDKDNQSGPSYRWGDDVRELSWQPYLMHIAKAIAGAVNYSFDFSAWENNERYKYLIICNSLPGAWDINGYARALPHWTVDEFFYKLELLLGGEFSINHKSKHIGFEFSKSIDNSIAPVCIDRVLDEFTAEVKVEEAKCEYVECRNFKYKDQNDEMWKFYNCKWYTDLIRYGDKSTGGNFVKFQEYDTLSELIEATKTYQTWNGGSGRNSTINTLFYVRQYEMYYVLKYYERVWVDGPKPYWNFKCFLQPVNSFGPLINTEEAEDKEIVEEELEFVPVAIDYTDENHGCCIFLYPSSYAESNNTDLDENEIPDNPTMWDDFWPSIIPDDFIKSGESDKSVAEYYNCIYLAFWDGKKKIFLDSRYGEEIMMLPRPYVENVNIGDNWEYEVSDFSLRLNDGSIKSRYRNLKLQTDKKYTFKFISDKIPSPRAIYIIRGKRYLCESLTVNFTIEGKSDLIKGVFWAIEE